MIASSIFLLTNVLYYKRYVLSRSKEENFVKIRAEICGEALDILRRWEYIIPIERYKTL